MSKPESSEIKHNDPVTQAEPERLSGLSTGPQTGAEAVRQVHEQIREKVMKENPIKIPKPLAVGGKEFEMSDEEWAKLGEEGQKGRWREIFNHRGLRMDPSDPVLFKKIDEYMAYWKNPPKDDEDPIPGVSSMRGQGNIQIPRHILERPGFKAKLDRLLKEENSEGLRLPHTFTVGGSTELINTTLVDRRNGIAERFPNDPLCDMICATYSLALHQLVRQNVAPDERLECLLTITTSTVLIDWRAKRVNLPTGMKSVAAYERFQAQDTQPI